MKKHVAHVNGVNIAYQVQGEGPPLVLVMGYRLNSTAWPTTFVEGLARRFRVITLDNRGTGQSDAPVEGYAIANMARDVAGLLDELEIDCTHILGYSMGGAIAQEFVRQFPQRVRGLVLCATLCGGPRATYMPPSVMRVVRNLDGLTPEEIARRMWKVTYSPEYIKKHRELAEEQMRREIAVPTPLHTADLQFQALAEFDCAKALPNIQSPTLVVTGDGDQMVPPENSKVIASLIPGAKLLIVPDCGHRVMWEATDECVALVAEFLANVRDDGQLDRGSVPSLDGGDRFLLDLVDFATPAINLFTKWPWMLMGAGVDTLAIARQSMYFGSGVQFGDGKPVILFPELGGSLQFLFLSNWLRMLGYRPETIDYSSKFDEPSALEAIRAISQRVGRKAVLVAPISATPLVARLAEAQGRWISDIVLLNASQQTKVPPGVRAHFVPSGGFSLVAMAALPKVLRNIQIELIEASSSGECEQTDCGSRPPSRVEHLLFARKQRR
jgi:pimeloyl-ACP methyl ester carboxylesterase